MCSEFLNMCRLYLPFSAVADSVHGPARGQIHILAHTNLMLAHYMCALLLEKQNQPAHQRTVFADVQVSLLLWLWSHIQCGGQLHVCQTFQPSAHSQSGAYGTFLQKITLFDEYMYWVMVMSYSRSHNPECKWSVVPWHNTEFLRHQLSWLCTSWRSLWYMYLKNVPVLKEVGARQYHLSLQ